jgi:hypothetical protein
MSKENHWTQNGNMQYMGLTWSLQIDDNAAAKDATT